MSILNAVSMGRFDINRGLHHLMSFKAEQARFPSIFSASRSFYTCKQTFRSFITAWHPSSTLSNPTFYKVYHVRLFKLSQNTSRVACKDKNSRESTYSASAPSSLFSRRKTFQQVGLDQLHQCSRIQKSRRDLAPIVVSDLDLCGANVTSGLTYLFFILLSAFSLYSIHSYPKAKHMAWRNRVETCEMPSLTIIFDWIFESLVASGFKAEEGIDWSKEDRIAEICTRQELNCRSIGGGARV